MREEALAQPAVSHTWLRARDVARSVTQVSDWEGEGVQGHISKEPTTASCLGGCAPSCCLATVMLSANDARNRIRWTFAFFRVIKPA